MFGSRDSQNAKDKKKNDRQFELVPFDVFSKTISATSSRKLNDDGSFQDSIEGTQKTLVFVTNTAEERESWIQSCQKSIENGNALCSHNFEEEDDVTFNIASHRTVNKNKEPNVSNPTVLVKQASENDEDADLKEERPNVNLRGKLSTFYRQKSGMLKATGGGEVLDDDEAQRRESWHAGSGRTKKTKLSPKLSTKSVNYEHNLSDSLCDKSSDGVNDSELLSADSTYYRTWHGSRYNI